MIERLESRMQWALLFIFVVLACLASYCKSNTAAGVAVMLLGRSWWDLYVSVMTLHRCAQTNWNQAPVDVLFTHLFLAMLCVMGAATVTLLFVVQL